MINITDKLECKLKHFFLLFARDWYSFAMLIQTITGTTTNCFLGEIEKSDFQKYFHCKSSVLLPIRYYWIFSSLRGTWEVEEYWRDFQKITKFCLQICSINSREVRSALVLSSFWWCAVTKWKSLFLASPEKRQKYSKMSLITSSNSGLWKIENLFLLTKFNNFKS